jgi:hypothetical protein
MQSKTFLDWQMSSGTSKTSSCDTGDHIVAKPFAAAISSDLKW